MLFVVLRGFVDQGTKDYGRITFEDNKFRAEGDPMAEWVLAQRIRDLRPGENRGKWLTAQNGEKFLRSLPYYFSGGRLCVSEVQEG